MSETIRDPLDIRAITARIDRDMEETRKFVAEAHKLSAEREALSVERSRLLAEQEKLSAERDKLAVEALKMERERRWYPWLPLLTVGLSSAAIGAVVARLLH